MKTGYKSGEIIDYANTGSAILSGATVLIGDLIGIAMNDIAATTGVGPVLVRGIVKTAKKTTGETWTQGQTLYWHAGNGEFTNVATSAQRAGCAPVAAGSGVNGYVLLNAPFNADVGVQSAHIADPASAAAITSTGPASAAALTQTVLADNSGGVSAGSVTEIGGTFSAGTISAIKNGFASVIARLAQVKVDVAAVRTGSEANNTAIDALITDVTAVRTGSEANNTAIDSTLAALETFKVVAAS